MKIQIEIPQVYERTETQWTVQIKKQDDGMVADYISVDGVCHEELACKIIN